MDRAQAVLSSLSAPPPVSMNKHRDPVSLSNYEAWRTQHTAVDIKLDFDKQTLAGKVKHTMKSVSEAESRQVILDTSFLDVKHVLVNGKQRDFNLEPRHPVYGQAMIITLEAPSKKDEIIQVDDTSDVKVPFDFRIQSPLQVLASGLIEDPDDVAGSSDKVYVFKQKVPIPAYLFAIASGELVSAPIGPRSTVWTGPLELEAAKWELEAETEKYIQIMEELIYPYVWGTYNVLVLPPSFPYGGMENPIYTFLTPTTISGDRQNVDVVAHELCHSWSGNLVTNASPEHPWLNEGWTVYFERRIARALHGDAARDFSAIIGWKALVDSVERIGADHRFTQLVYALDGEDPDDAYSQVMYEKGFCFLYYLENLIGMAEFDRFARHYFTVWKYKSLDSYEFKATFIDFFTGEDSNDLTIMRLRTVDWDRWFYGKGLPPKPKFDTSMADVCYALADKWKTPEFKPSAADIDGWTSSQVVVFLEAVQLFEKPLSAAQSHAMGEAYALTKSANAELASRYYVIALRAHDDSAVDAAVDFLGRIGRMKFTRPVYTWLERKDRALAMQTFEKNKDFYHPICRKVIEKVLFEGQGEG